MNVFEQARESHPAETDAFYEIYLRGVAFEKLGDHQKAMALFGEILESMPQHFPSALHTGDIYRRSSQYKEAIEAYTLAEKFLLKNLPNSNDESIPFYIWLFSGKGRAHEAIKDYRNALDCYGKLKTYEHGWQKDQFPEGIARRINSLEKKLSANGTLVLSEEQLTRMLGKQLKAIADNNTSSLITRVFKLSAYSLGQNPKIDKTFAAWWAESLFLSCHLLETSFSTKPLIKRPEDLYLKASSMALNAELKLFSEHKQAHPDGHFEGLLGQRLREYNRVYSEKKKQDSVYKKFSLYATQVAGLDSLTALTFIRTATAAGSTIKEELDVTLQDIAKKMAGKS